MLAAKSFYEVESSIVLQLHFDEPLLLQVYLILVDVCPSRVAALVVVVGLEGQYLVPVLGRTRLWVMLVCACVVVTGWDRVSGTGQLLATVSIVH